MLSTHKYTIFKDGSNYKALNNDTGIIDSTNTNARVVINSATNAVHLTGGGTIFFKAATKYTNTDGQPIVPKSNVLWLGEQRDTTIIENPTVFVSPPWYQPIQNFGIVNMHLTDNRGGTNPQVLVEIQGTKDCYFLNNRVQRTSPVSAFLGGGFLFHFKNWDRANVGIKCRDNIFEGHTGGQDMVGGGSFFGCDFSNNILRKLTSVGVEENNGQGIAFHESIGCHYDNNTFYNLRGNAIGGEGGAKPGVIPVENNTFNNNTITSCMGGIKLASQDLNEDCTMNNSICNNVFMYGQDYGGGIRAGHSVYDTIANNTFFRTKYRGIWGCFNGCDISNNKFVDTNYDNHYMTGGIPAAARTGGIELYNNPFFPSDAGGDNLITDNLFIRTGVAFTIPDKYNTSRDIFTDFIDAGLSVTGHTGGIGIQSGYSNDTIKGNKFVNIEATNLINIASGATPIIRDNDGYRTENENATANVSHGGTIAHGLVGIPKMVVANGSISGESVSITAKNTSTFTVAIKKTNGSNGTPQTIYWRASM